MAGGNSASRPRRRHREVDACAAWVLVTLRRPQGASRAISERSVVGVLAVLGLELRHLVRLRDGRCRAFGCTRSATRCDVDHATPFDREGPTSGENLASLCRFHHRAKQQKQWRYLLDPDTGVTWWIHAVTGAMRTTVTDICLGPHAWSPAPRRRPPESRGVDDRVATPTGDHPYDPGRPRGDDPVSLSGSVLARARRAIADPTIPF